MCVLRCYVDTQPKGGALAALSLAASMNPKEPASCYDASLFYAVK